MATTSVTSASDAAPTVTEWPAWWKSDSLRRHRAVAPPVFVVVVSTCSGLFLRAELRATVPLVALSDGR